MPHTAVIDLTTGHIQIAPTPERLIRALLGGRGMNMHYLRKFLSARTAGDPKAVDPFGPDNPLIFGAGLLTGTIAPNSPPLLGYGHFTELTRAATGLEFTEAELREAGRKVIDVERLINLDFGRSRADDTLPKRYFDDPMPARVTKGHHIDREKFARMLDEYYEARGWDREGRLAEERVRELERINLSADRGAD